MRPVQQQEDFTPTGNHIAKEKTNGTKGHVNGITRPDSGVVVTRDFAYSKVNLNGTGPHAEGEGDGYIHFESSLNIYGETYTGRAEETADLLQAVQKLLLPFIAHADAKVVDEVHADEDTIPLKRDALVKSHDPEQLSKLLQFGLPEQGTGKQGLTEMLEKVLRYSVNTWHQGFMHKLYATTNPIGIASELILACLNTAVHVYKVSPVLSVIERQTGQMLARLFGFTGSHAGGSTHPGGTASNLAALVTARNTLFPDIRNVGNGGRRLAVFTSRDSHYSITKAAQTCGIGANNVFNVPVDESGRMRVDILAHLIQRARHDGMSPFFVNATAGTTVLGACDPLHEIADLCERESLWMHVDASWGGGAAFTDDRRHRLDGVARARSCTFNPHKMLGVPITCSFLLGADMRVFWRANRVDAGYLFHDDLEEDEGEVSWDLADSTLQCGRRGDAIKLALSWIYYGREGLGRYVSNAFSGAEYLADRVRKHPDLILVSTFPPPCLQVCFYHQPDGSGSVEGMTEDQVTQQTKKVCDGLVEKGLMIDHAPGPRGNFVRVVINGATTKNTIDCIVDYIVAMK